MANEGSDQLLIINKKSDQLSIINKKFSLCFLYSASKRVVSVYTGFDVFGRWVFLCAHK